LLQKHPRPGLLWAGWQKTQPADKARWSGYPGHQSRSSPLF
jgi:hypothetical protein